MYWHVHCLHSEDVHMKALSKTVLILLVILFAIDCSAHGLERSGVDAAVAGDDSRDSSSKTDENAPLRENVQDSSSADGNVSVPLGSRQD